MHAPAAAPPHMSAGWSFGELGAAVTVFGAICGLLLWAIKVAVVTPAVEKEDERMSAALDKVSASTDKLEAAINDLNTSAKLLTQQLGAMEGRVNDHGQRLRRLEDAVARHDEALNKGGTF